MNVESILDERHKRILEFIAPASGDKILVIGTGNCPRIEYLLFNIYGCEDIVSGDIKSKHTETAKAVLPKLKFIYLDAQKPFPLADGTFDKVVFTEVLEHLKDEDLPLQEIRRVLKSSGKLTLSVPKRRWFTLLNPVSWLEHEREYTEKLLAGALEKNGLKIEKIIAFGNIYDLFDFWCFLLYKYLFSKEYNNNTFFRKSFFRLQFEKSYHPDFKGKGSDIIVKAGVKL